MCVCTRDESFEYGLKTFSVLTWTCLGWANHLYLDWASGIGFAKHGLEHIRDFIKRECLWCLFFEEKKT